MREVKLKQKHFIKKHMKTNQGRITHHNDGDDMVQDSGGSSGSTSRPEKRKSEEEAEDERLCEDNRVTTGMKRKAEDEVDLEIICCMCEEPLEIHAAWIEDKLLYNEAVLEEKAWNWADASEEEQNERNACDEQETFHDDLTGRVLKYEKAIAARLNEIESFGSMGSGAPEAMHI